MAATLASSDVHAKARPRPSSGVCYVLVHGAWHGGWAWRRVMTLLNAAGHEVHAPSLTGLGDRSHLAAPGITLSTHIEDIVAILAGWDLSNVVLVGHSYAGFVIAGVAARAVARIRRLVFLDAFVPADGERVMDYQPPNLHDVVRERGEGWRLPPDALFSLEDLGVTDPRDVAWVRPRLRDQPFATYTEPLSLPRSVLRSLDLAYIRTSDMDVFRSAQRRAESLGARSVTLPGTGHDAMITHPELTAAQLTALA